MAKAYALDLGKKVIHFVSAGGPGKERRLVFLIEEKIRVDRWIRREKAVHLSAKKPIRLPHKVDVQGLIRYVEG